MALVSIIMAAYNAEEFINDSISSVIAQTYSDWELLVVDDGSFDRTHQICQRFAEDDPRISVIEAVHGGVSSARNCGLNIAKGEYITFLDADDVLPPFSLELRVNHLVDQINFDIVDGCISVRSHDLLEQIRRYVPYYRGSLLRRLIRLDERVFFNGCYLVKRRGLSGIRFVEGMTHGEDLLFFIRAAAAHSLQYTYVDADVYWYRQSKFSAMSNICGLEKGYVRLVKAIREMRAISLLEKHYFRSKVCKVMVLSWLSRGEWLKALKSAWLIFSAKQM
ncbi:MAG: glycosyltransferase [Sulfuricella sp.]|nr:glycosyltransferase [Sulfuricella sp.]